MTEYFVMHPSLDTKVKVTAPSTEKARTVLLDYLERQGRINKEDRGYWRRSMVAERLEFPEDVSAELELNYGYSEAAPQMQSWDREPVRSSPDEYSMEPVEGEYEEQPPTQGVPSTIQQAALKEPEAQRMSPIARASRSKFIKTNIGGF